MYKNSVARPSSITNPLALNATRWSMALVYIWFGALKFFPNLSPAEAIAGRTLNLLTFGLLSPERGVLALAIGECAIGLWMLSGRAPRASAAVAVLHLMGTFSPFVLFPSECFAFFPLGLSLLGQYIFKNVVLLGTMVLLATQRSEAERPLTLPAFLRIAPSRLVAPIISFFDDAQSEPAPSVR